jgi:hypothetical protein
LADDRLVEANIWDLTSKLDLKKRSSPDGESNTETLEREIISSEKNMATTDGRSEYSRRPTSFKCSLSMALPVGTWRKKGREMSPPRIVESKKQH